MTSFSPVELSEYPTPVILIIDIGVRLENGKYPTLRMFFIQRVW